MAANIPIIDEATGRVVDESLVDGDIVGRMQGLKDSGVTREEGLKALEHLSTRERNVDSTGKPLEEKMQLGDGNALMSAFESVFGEEEVKAEIPLREPKELPAREEGLVRPNEGMSDLVADDTFKGTDLLDVEIQEPIFTFPEMMQQVFITDQLKKTNLSTKEIVDTVEDALINGTNPVEEQWGYSLDDLYKENFQANLLSEMGDDVEKNEEKLKAFFQVVQYRPEGTAFKLEEALYTALPNETTLYGGDFLKSMKLDIEMLHHMGKASQVISKGYDVWETAGDLGELLVPFYGEAVYLEFQAALSEGKLDVAKNLLVGSHNLDKVVERYWDTPDDEKAEFIYTFMGDISRIRVANESENKLLMLDMTSKIFDKISEGPQAVGRMTKTDVLPILETTLSELGLVMPLVGVIKNMMKMRKLSRAIDFNYEGVTERLQNHRFQRPEYDKAHVHPDGGSGTVLDIYTGKSPNSFKKLLEDKEIEDVVKVMGVEAVDMPIRVLPRIGGSSDNTITPPNVHHTNLSDKLQRKIDNNHYAVQLTETERQGLTASHAVRLSEYLGESVTPHLNRSFFEALDDPTGVSLGSFVVRLGENSSRGFSSLEDAQRISNQLYGEDSKVVRMLPEGTFTDLLVEGRVGEFFIEVRQQHTFNPELDSALDFLGGQGTATGGRFKPILNYIVDDDYLMNSQIQKTMSNMRDRSNAFGIELDRAVQPFAAISSNKASVEDFNMLSLEMQSRGWDVVDVAKLQSVLGRKPSREVVAALEAAQLINLANYRIKNSAEYSKLNSEMYKTVRIGGSNFISKPVLDKPSASSIKGVEIYDHSRASTMSLSDANIQKLYDEGGIIAELYKSTRVGDSNYTHIVVRYPEGDVKPLQPDVIPYVKGHFERIYEDDGFVVLGTESIKVNGKTQLETVVYGIAPTRGAAKNLAEALRAEGKNVKAGKGVDAPIQATPAYATRMGIKTSAGFALEKSMEKGERLKGMKGSEYGLAEIADPYSAFGKVLNKTKGKFEQPTIDLQKARWMKSYGGLLKERAFPSNLGFSDKGVYFKDVTKNTDAINDAINFHRKIRLQENGDMERAKAWFNGVVNDWAMVLGEKQGPKSQWLSQKLDGINFTKVVGVATGIAATRFILGNTPFQVLGAVAQAPFLAAQGPLVFAKAMHETAFMLVPALMTAGGEGKIHNLFMKGMARGLGVSRQEADGFLQAIIDSGIIRTAGAGQDYAVEVGKLREMIMSFGPKTRWAASNAEKVFNIPIKTTKGLFLGSIDLYELLAFNVSKNLWLKENKGGNWLKAEAIEEILRGGRNLTKNQNNTANMAYQANDSLARIPMALMSYLQKAAMRDFVDPLTLGAAGRLMSPKGDKKGKNLNAKNVATGLGFTAIGFAFFGDSYVDPLDGDFYESKREYMRAIANGDYKSLLTEADKAAFKAIGIDNPSQFMLELRYQGLQTNGMNAMFDGNVDWGDMFQTNSFIKAMYDKVTAIQEGKFTEVVGGVPYLASAGVVNTVKHVFKMSLAAQDARELSEVAVFSLIESLSLIKVIDDSMAAYMAINLGRRVSKTNFDQREKTTMYEQISKIFGGVSQSEMMSRINYDRSNLPRTSSDNELNFVLRKTNWEIFRAYQDKGDWLTEAEVTDIAAKNLNILINMGDEFNTNDVEEEFRRKLLDVGSTYKYGDIVVDEAMQESAIQVFKYALNDKSPQEWIQMVQEKIGELDLLIEASPNEASLKYEKEYYENYLNSVGDMTSEELNKEIHKERTGG